MHTSVQAVRTQPSTIPNPLALWHLLSLDAPTVAALWTWFVARESRAPLAPAIPIAMFLAVWLLYSVDRLLDGRGTGCEELEPRHLFHREHRRAFIATMIAVSIGLAAMLHEIPGEILRRYYVLGALLSLWFVAIHLITQRRSLPKEIVPGPFFAAAAFMPIFRPSMTPAAVAFALLCILNCLSIYAWEHSPPLRWLGTPHPGTRLGIRFLNPILGFAIMLPLLLIFATPDLTPILLAESLAAALLFSLNRFHRRFEPTDLRAAADLVLLTPLLIAPFLR